MFEWSKYLDLANELVQREDEAAKRTAVSRAYYSVFCMARNWLEVKSIPIGHGMNDHHIVWSTFEKLQGKRAKKIGLEGQRLRRARNMMDYDNSVPQLSSTIKSSMQRANAIFADLKQMT